MIWFFDRGGEKLRYEIGRDRSAGRYRIIITHPDGSESVEEVDEPTDFVERSVELMSSRRGDGLEGRVTHRRHLDRRSGGERNEGLA
jgi:hypothetical protein